ncbi:MAG: hypothetical protein H9W81_01105 [Enterococcus sp.]|nr:hypothetical protein [Enterococcus sp.]
MKKKLMIVLGAGVVVAVLWSVTDSNKKKEYLSAAKDFAKDNKDTLVEAGKKVSPK